jgi:hypothetical protein
MKVNRRMGSGQSCLTVYWDLNMDHSNVIKLIKNADKIEKTMETARRKTATTLISSHCPLTGKMELVLSSEIMIQKIILCKVLL